MNDLTPILAERVAMRMRRDGFEDCVREDVDDVYYDGALANNEALASRILQEFSELGIEVPA